MNNFLKIGNVYFWPPHISGFQLEGDEITLVVMGSYVSVPFDSMHEAETEFNAMIKYLMENMK